MDSVVDGLEFLVCESDQQYRAQAKDHLSSHQLADFRRSPLLCAHENAAAIERLKACQRRGVWPTGYEEIRVFDNG